jgi:hypothetical protein
MMGPGRWWLSIGLAAAGCAGPAPERHGPVAPAPASAWAPPVWDRHLWGEAPAGARAVYRINGTRTLELVSRGDGWIEVADSAAGPGVSLRWVRDGRVLEAYTRAAPGSPPVAQPILQAPAGLCAAGFEPPSGTRLRVERTQGPPTRVVETWEDALGYPFTIETVWSRDVPPLYAGGPDGGLLLRRTPTARVEWVGPGTEPAVPR